jgi:hypothetical protein
LSFSKQILGNFQNGHIIKLGMQIVAWIRLGCRENQRVIACEETGGMTVIFDSNRLLLPIILVLLGPVPANAAVTISSGVTTNMTCSAGICAPTAADAVLNVGDLETLLASGSVAVTTTGSGVEAKNVVVKDSVTWSAGSALTLDAWQSVTIDKAVSVTGQGALTITTNDGGNDGSLVFGRKGRVDFQNLSSTLTINSVPYLLVNSVASLATAIASNPNGAYALASAYDASGDGTYKSAAIPTTFNGSFEGLGNTIANLSIHAKASGNVGLFAEISSTGNASDVGVTDAAVKGSTKSTIGALVALNNGTLSNCWSSGSISTFGKRDHSDYYVGGLAGSNNGVVGLSFSSVEVFASGSAGGLVGFNGAGTIELSFATGNVTGSIADGALGGLVGENSNRISESYAIGAVSPPSNAYVGGLAGVNFSNKNNAEIIDSYSTGKVSDNTDDLAGGFIGESGGLIKRSYWDTTTSGTDIGVGDGSSTGLTGLTTAQLQSGLPKGFDKKIWAEDPNINNGFPYLIANPPPK